MRDRPSLCRVLGPCLSIGFHMRVWTRSPVVFVLESQPTVRNCLSLSFSVFPRRSCVDVGKGALGGYIRIQVHSSRERVGSMHGRVPRIFFDQQSTQHVCPRNAKQTARDLVPFHRDSESSAVRRRLLLKCKSMGFSTFGRWEFFFTFHCHQAGVRTESTYHGHGCVTAFLRADATVRSLSSA